MSDERPEPASDEPLGSTSAGRPAVTVPAWVEETLRYAVAALVVAPGVSKFVTYERSVASFRALDIPNAAVLVLVVGGVEVAAAAALFLDRYARVAALALVPVMAVAAATAGVTWQNAVVLAGGLALPFVESANSNGVDA